MSRRESRSSLGARQNDALFEFENCELKLAGFSKREVSDEQCVAFFSLLQSRRNSFWPINISQSAAYDKSIWISFI